MPKEAPMQTIGHCGPDGLVRVSCPRQGCGKRLKFKAHTGQGWITCPRPGCGERLKVCVSEGGVDVAEGRTARAAQALGPLARQAEGLVSDLIGTSGPSIPPVPHSR